MNKTELIEAIATRSNTTKTQTTSILNGLLNVIQENMASGNNVQLVGFGTFSVTERAGREGRIVKEEVKHGRPAGMQGFLYNTRRPHGEHRFYRDA